MAAPDNKNNKGVSMDGYLNAVTGKEENVQGSGGAINVNVVSGGGVGGGTTSSGASGIIGTDSASVLWLMVADTSTNPATVKYFRLSDGVQGTPAGNFVPDSDLNNTVIGQRVKKLASNATFTLATAQTRNAGTLLNGLVAVQTGAPALGFVTITGVSIASSNGAVATGARAQFTVFSFGASSPAGLQSTLDNSVFSLTQAASAQAGHIGLLGGTLQNSGTASYGYAMNGLAVPQQVDANGRFWLAFVLNGNYTNIVNEQFAINTHWAD
jgi:hypothetical protein